MIVTFAPTGKPVPDATTLDPAAPVDSESWSEGPTANVELAVFSAESVAETECFPPAGVVTVKLQLNDPTGEVSVVSPTHPTPDQSIITEYVESAANPVPET